MLNFLVYAVTFSAALSVVALCLESLAVIRDKPRRMHWLLAMSCSTLLPPLLALNAQPGQPVSPAAPMPALSQPAPAVKVPAFDTREAASQPAFTASPTNAPAVPRAWRVPTPSSRTLLLAWAAISTTLLSFLVGSGLLLRRRSARWQRTSIRNDEVLLSENTGPALIGVLRPKIVVPRWFMDETADTQLLILEHERQHITARDPLLLRVAMLMAISAPWNLPLWWQLRRLRLAIELDCDARVLRCGVKAARYGEVLLGVTRRVYDMPAGAIAMSEPVSALEQRIRNLVKVPDRYAGLRSVIASMIAVVGVGAAVALEAPAFRMPPVPRAPTSVPDTPRTDATAQSSQQSVPPAASPAGDEQRPSLTATTAIPPAFSVDAVIDERVNPDGTPPQPNNAPGTPLLVDMRRMVSTSNQANVVDPNIIPSNLLERMNVVTGGASATYGSGAMAGVVNLVLNNRATGFKLDMDYGINEAGDGTSPHVSASDGLPLLGGGGHDSASVGDCAAARAWCRDRESRASSAAPVASNWVDLRELIGSNGDRFNRRFIVDPRVGVSVDIGGLDPASISYSVFLEFLGVHGFAAVRSGDMVTIVPGEYALSIASPPVRADSYMGDEAEVVTALIPIQRPDLLTPLLLSRTLSPWGHVSVTADMKSMLLMDKVAIVKRVATMMQGRSETE